MTPRLANILFLLLALLGNARAVEFTTVEIAGKRITVCRVDVKKERLQLWHQRKCGIGQFEDIRLSDLDCGGPGFRAVTLAPLQLVKDTDPRRFSRVKR